jgi:hypothetical protein
MKQTIKIWEKVYFTPTYEGWNTSPPTYENGFFTLELSQTRQINPEAVLKNHSKSQKNHKIENSIVLD